MLNRAVRRGLPRRQLFDIRCGRCGGLFTHISDEGAFQISKFEGLELGMDLPCFRTSRKLVHLKRVESGYMVGSFGKYIRQGKVPSHVSNSQ